ncbi:MAG: universal stress protein [Desulfuromonadaceae bacterium]|nr:universal stress protein [Desulfuromonadaceae bacterium]
MVLLRNSKILVPVDGSKTSARTIAAIVENSEHFQSVLTVLHVIDVDRLAYRMIPDFQVDMVEQHARSTGRALIEKQANFFREAGLIVDTRLESGSPREVICRIANEEGFHLVILSRRGTGVIRDVLFGSVSNYVLHHVACPVLLF